MKDTKKILAKANSFDYVSFDIFDTLVIRNVLKPSDIFYYVEKELNREGVIYPGFQQARINGESQAIASNKETDEITFNGIYENITFESDVDKEKAKRAEVNAEIKFCIPNNEMVDVLNTLRKKGKKIVIISDMYLPKSAIADILHRCKITYDYLYVSSEYGFRKSSGKLYRKVISDLGIKRDELIHIGDNKRSDYLVPKFMGFNAIRYEKEYTPFIENNPIKETVYSRTVYTYKRNITAKKDADFTIGYNYLGPLLSGYCQWIHRQMKENPRRLLFFARDGYIMQKAYQILFPTEKSDYVAISRRSITVPMLENAYGWQDVVRIVGYVKREETWKTLLHKMGFADDNLFERKFNQQYGEHISKERLLHDESLRLAFEQIKESMWSIAKKEKEEAKRYLDHFFNDKIAIADIGWYGTMQQTLRSFYNGQAVQMEGYYVGLLKRDGYDNSGMHGYVYDEPNGTSQFNSQLIYGFNGLIESFFSANHGSTQKYDKGEPVFEEWESENWPVISKVHEGAVQFCKDIRSLIEEYGFIFDVEEAFSGLNRLMTKPHKRDIEALGNLVFFDTYYEPLVKKPNRLRYIVRPKGLLRDLMASNWKIGFLKKLTGLSASDKVYLLLMKLK